jgi:hypothetical protein
MELSQVALARLDKDFLAVLLLELAAVEQVEVVEERVE